jgi:hypothetical protein
MSLTRLIVNLRVGWPVGCARAGLVAHDWIEGVDCVLVMLLVFVLADEIGRLASRETVVLRYCADIWLFKSAGFFVVRASLSCTGDIACLGIE